MYIDNILAWLDNPLWIKGAIAGSVLLLSLVISLLFTKVFFRFIIRFADRTSTSLDDRILKSIRTPITIGIVILGIYIAVTIFLGQQHLIDSGARLLGIVFGIVVLGSVVSNTFEWYSENIGRQTHSKFDARLFPLFKRIASVTIYGLGALMIMDQLKINISPLIAGLGLGGLAVALAIQPTLSNIFAGTYVMTEGVINPGDYIETENGINGYVIGVSWRSTRIRTWNNNLVVVPNSKFAETVITNYEKPTTCVNVFLPCGVSYDSNLTEVEKICSEVMNDVLNTNPDAVKEFGGWFGYDGFGESNVNFWLFVQAKNRSGSYTVQSDLIKQLMHRFNEESIVINYPVRSLHFPNNADPEILLEGKRQSHGKATDTGERSGESQSSDRMS